MKCHLLVVTDDISLRQAIIREVVQQANIQWSVYGLGDEIPAIAGEAILWVLVDLRVSEENLYMALDAVRKVAVPVRYATICQSTSNESKLVEWLNAGITGDDLDDLPKILKQIADQCALQPEKEDSNIDSYQYPRMSSARQRVPKNLALPLVFVLQKDGELSIGGDIMPDAAALLKSILLKVIANVKSGEVMRYISLLGESEKVMLFAVNTSVGLVGAVLKKGVSLLNARQAVYQLGEFIVKGGAVTDARRYLNEQMKVLNGERESQELFGDEEDAISSLAEILDDGLIPPEPDVANRAKAVESVHLAETDARSMIPDDEFITVDTQAHGQAESADMLKGDSEVDHANTLQYHFMLITRFPENTISESLAESIVRWARDVSIAFGWRLNSIEIRGEIFQWQATAPPSIAPVEIARQMRDYLSQRIMQKFPHYCENNPGGDFWAPGFYVSSGDNVPSDAKVRKFVEITRQNQGLID